MNQPRGATICFHFCGKYDPRVASSGLLAAYAYTRSLLRHSCFPTHDSSAVHRFKFISQLWGGSSIPILDNKRLSLAHSQFLCNIKKLKHND
jgi:hypothetical protein